MYKRGTRWFGGTVGSLSGVHMGQTPAHHAAVLTQIGPSHPHVALSLAGGAVVSSS